MQKITGIVFTLSFAFIACGRDPLQVSVAKDALVATATDTQTNTQTTLTTSERTNTTVDTATATQPQTAAAPTTVTVTTTAAATETTSITAKLGIRVRRSDDTPASQDIVAGTADNDITNLIFDADRRWQQSFGYHIATHL